MQIGYHQRLVIVHRRTGGLERMDPDYPRHDRVHRRTGGLESNAYTLSQL